LVSQKKYQNLKPKGERDSAVDPLEDEVNHLGSLAMGHLLLSHPTYATADKRRKKWGKLGPVRVRVQDGETIMVRTGGLDRFEDVRWSPARKAWYNG